MSNFLSIEEAIELSEIEADDFRENADTGCLESSHRSNKAKFSLEKIMRIIAALTFIITGLYYINIYLKII